MTQDQFELMSSTLMKTVQHLEKNRIIPFLSGSFAICVYAGKMIGDPQDIDFLFQSRDEQARAVSLLEEQLSFTLVKQLTWESDTDDESINTKMSSPEGIEFDLACTIGDISLSFDPKNKIMLQGRAVQVLSLEDIKKSYLRFFDEKPGSTKKIAEIDELLK